MTTESTFNTPPASVYQAHGYANRRAYLEGLAEEYPRALVFALAEILGPGEDFDALITSLEDESQFFDME